MDNVQTIALVLLMVSIGAGLIAVALHNKSPFKNAPLVAGVVMIVGVGVIAAGAYYGIVSYDIPVSETQAALDTGLAGSWDFDLSTLTISGQSHVSWTDQTHTSIKVEMAFNDTSDAFIGGSQWVVLNFTGDNNNNFHSALDGEVVTIGDFIYTSGGASTVYKILEVDGDGVYSATWTKDSGNTGNMDVSWSPPTTDFDDTYVTLNLTANDNVVALMQDNDVATTQIEIRDQQTGVLFYTLDVLWEKEDPIT